MYDRKSRARRKQSAMEKMKALRGLSRGTSAFGNQLTGPQARGQRTPIQQGYNTTSVGPAHAQFEQQPTALESLLTARNAYTGAKEVNRLGSDLYHAGEPGKPFGPGGAFGAGPGTPGMNYYLQTGNPAPWDVRDVAPEWLGGYERHYGQGSSKLFPGSENNFFSRGYENTGAIGRNPAGGLINPTTQPNPSEYAIGPSHTSGISGAPLGLQGQSPTDKANVMRNIGSSSGTAGGGLGGPANSGGGLLDSLSSGISNLGSDIGSFFSGADDAGVAMGDMANMPTKGGETLSGLQGSEAVDAGGGMSGLGTALTGAGGAFGLYQGIEEGSALKMGGNAASLAMLTNPVTAPFAWIPQIVNFF